MITTDSSPLRQALLPPSAKTIETALLRRLLAPEDLTPDDPVHQQGFVDAARTDPTLPIPPRFLAALSDPQLWQLTGQPAAVRELLLRLSTSDRHVTAPTRRHETSRTQLPGALESAIVAAYRERRLTGRDIASLTRAFPPSGPTLAALAQLRTQRQRPKRPRPSNTPPAPRRRSTDHLPLAARVREALARTSDWALWRLPLEELTPADLASLLPAWQAAAPRSRAALLNVPALDGTLQAAAFAAWLESDSYHAPKQPIPLALVQAAPGEALPRILRAFFRRELHVAPPPSPRQIDDLLFVVALSDPEAARELRDSATFAAWWDELRALSDVPETHTATDPAAAWLALAVADAKYDRDLMLQLHAHFTQWPRERQQALAPILLDLHFPSAL